MEDSQKSNQDKSQPSQGGLQEMDRRAVDSAPQTREAGTIDRNTLGTAEPDSPAPEPQATTADVPDVATSLTGGIGPDGGSVSNGPEDQDRLYPGGIANRPNQENP